MTNEKLTNEEVIKILKEAIDVINRQETKIVILKDYTKDLIAEIRKIRREAKAEAYKEFAERLNRKAQIADCFNSYSMVVGTHFIDNLLKEMVGEEE